ncbi:MAG: tol-pal system protein YbgF [Geminicoccaceae bacterium]
MRPAGLIGLSLLGLAVATSASAEPAASLRASIERLSAEAGRLGRIELVQARQDPARMAEFEVRLARIEEELRALTGRLESLEYAQAQSDARIDKLVADLDNRLRGMEGGEVAPAPRAEAPPAPAVEVAPPAAVAPQPRPATAAEGGPPVEPTARPPVSDEDAAAQRGYVLGTLPGDALRGETGDGGVPAEPPQQQAALPRAAGPKAAYDAAVDLLQAGDFTGARGAFDAFMSDYPKDPLVPSAAYWLAETHYVQRDFSTAAALFARNFQTYGQGAPKAADNLLRMAMALGQLGEKAQACQTYDELDRRFPNAAAPIKQAAARGRASAGCG